ncbi:hypothetical protein [Demequina sp. NBRC 110053]|uniref:hypothetical protein n=1 Tax=Demequina sp. NBRC 110053 TaxID=1570342 RepID=UPI001186C1C7|nr:hypothetical protein [Demequina sp. NBRC 110053]
MSTRDPARPRPPEADVSSLLYLGSTPARALVVLFVAANAIFTVATLDVLINPWQSFAAMLIVSLAGLLLARAHPDPFPRRDTNAVLAVVIVSSVLVATNLTDAESLGRATWHLGSNTWLLFFLALRRRAAMAWLGMAAMAAITIAWAHVSGRGVVAGVMMLNTHVGILLVGTLFATALRRTGRRIASLERRSIAAAAEQAESAAAEEIRRTRSGELARLAVPLLEQIAAGGPFEPSDRARFRLAEAALRDGVRGRSLMLPEVVQAAAGARSRGVAVTILDDRGSLPTDGDSAERLSGAVVAALEAASAGTVTIRLVPAGRSTALTIVASEGEHVRRTTLAPDGHEIARVV